MTHLLARFIGHLPKCKFYHCTYYINVTSHCLKCIYTIMCLQFSCVVQKQARKYVISISRLRK